MNRLLSGAIRVEDYVVDPSLVAQAMIDRLVSERPSAVLIALDSPKGEARGRAQCEAVPLVDNP